MSERDDQLDDETAGEADARIEAAALREAEEIQEREFYGSGAGTDTRSSEHLWLISYSDFMTILMIFFLAMYGYSYLMKQKQAPPQITVDQFTAAISQMKDEMGEQVRVIDEFDKVTIELGEGILFNSGSAQLSAVASKTLGAIGGPLKQVAGDVIVEGHTDNVPIRGGRFRSNWELSAARAFSVIQELTRAGVPAKRLAAWGFGENRPVVSNETAEERRRNRRIDIVVLKPKAKNA